MQKKKKKNKWINLKKYQGNKKNLEKPVLRIYDGQTDYFFSISTWYLQMVSLCF